VLQNLGGLLVNALGATWQIASARNGMYEPRDGNSEGKGAEARQRLCSLQSPVPVQTSEVNGLVSQVVDGANVADGAAACAHKD